ncbi:ring-cleaving dioxygenase [Staphylococcus arlettae]|uniref:ring-cleaving dioxygenase n=1 Tax=Staphylococcus arlettae TaxID=29378 RepID=UPI001E5E7F3F|nr:ring-cleaving dioxygenase [Staphylococcus arlettae]MCD9055143.1 ring-cleaving dioxygenase [Staphylococcus arlettae]
MEAIKHIHHISAIVGNPEENIRFYRDILNLKLIKKTVNFDDPGTYHLYFSNNSVANGTILTFFNWPNHVKGQVGAGQVETIAFRIPQGTMDLWEQHLNNHAIKTKRNQLFDQETLVFKDTHDLPLALVESETTSDNHDIIGFHGVTMLSSNPVQTIATLTNDMGLSEVNDSNVSVHLTTAGEWQHHVIVHKTTPEKRVRWGTGVVHHIAWSMPTNETQLAWREQLSNKGYHLTEVKDRNYFNAVYMKEHGDIIFEFATDGPGFTVDEPFDELGTHLMLPPQYEERREELLQLLPPINI